MNNQPRQEVIDHNIGICGLNVPIPNGESYIPANGTEGDMFELHWCKHCKHEDEANEQYCDIHTEALLGEPIPQWMYWEKSPICTEWERKA